MTSNRPRRTGLVMAASKGLGRACAEALASAGHDLVICARHTDALAASAEAIRSHGGRALAVEADVSRRDDLEALFQEVDREYGRLDVLVANAGGPPHGSFLDVSLEQWEQAFTLTLMSAVRAMRLAVPRMEQNGYGRIVVIGSYSVKQAIDGMALSNAFRPALVGAVKTLAREVAPVGITVNLVSPGRIETERVRAIDDSQAQGRGVSAKQVRTEMESAIPMGRYGEPRELAALVAFFASEAAGYITGQSVVVDGGMVPALP